MTTVAEIVVLPHIPARPQWDCGHCGEPWPCDMARDRLAAEYRGYEPTLLMYLMAQLTDAIHDLALDDIKPGPLRERFLDWATNDKGET